MADQHNSIPHLSYRKRELPPANEILAEVDRMLRYDADNGGFVWEVPSGYNRASWKNKKAGGSDGSGYEAINILGYRVKIHRLVWLWHNKEWPAGLLDHINGNRLDNRIENLRPATMAENVRNRIKRCGDLLIGVSRDKAGRYKARIQLPSGDKAYLGSFDTEAEAAAAYVGAATILHGEFSVFTSRELVGGTGIEPVDPLRVKQVLYR